MSGSRSMRAVNWSVESEMPYTSSAGFRSTVGADGASCGNNRSAATHLLPRQRLPVFLIVLANVDHCHVLELRDLYTSLPRDLTNNQRCLEPTKTVNS